MIRLIHFVEGASVEDIAPEKLVNRTVQLVSSAAGDDIYLASACAAHLSGIASRLNFEFLDRIGRRAEVERVERGVCIGDAIEQKVVRIRTIAADADGR